jgi:hypothetical protein
MDTSSQQVYIATGTREIKYLSILTTLNSPIFHKLLATEKFNTYRFIVEER